MSRYIQIYTGNGKGKTTAALGLPCVRPEPDTAYTWASS